MHTHIKHHHLRSINQTRRVLQLVRERKLREPVHSREPLAVFVHHEEPLEAAEVGKSEHDEDAIAPPVDLVPFFAFGDYLDHNVRCGGFGGGDDHLEGEGVCFGE